MPLLDLRDEAGKKCISCGILNVTGSTRQDVCSYTAPLQNVAVAFLADGNGFGKGNVKWRCCNCAKDIKFGVTTLTPAQYEKTACIQCKNRPRELCFQMRQEHFALNPPQPSHLQYATSTKKFIFSMTIALVILAGCIGFFVFARRNRSDPMFQPSIEGNATMAT